MAKASTEGCTESGGPGWVQPSTSERVRSGQASANSCATTPPIETPSTWAENSPAASRTAADAAAVLDAAGEFSAHVLGVSMGGVVAQEFALACPERTRSLVLGCTESGGPGWVQPSVDALAMLGQRSRMTLALSLIHI